MTDRPKDGDVLTGGELGTEFPFTKTLLRLFIDLNKNSILTLTREDYDNISWDTFINDTYWSVGNSSNIVVNNTAMLVALDVDPTNSLYVADFTGVARDGTYTESEPGTATVTFDAANNEEDFASAGSSAGIAKVSTTTTYRDGICTVKLDNPVSGQAGDVCGFVVRAFGESISGYLISSAPDYFSVDGTTYTGPLYLKITKKAGIATLERSADGAAWTTISDTENSSIGTAGACEVELGDYGNATAASFSLQEWTVDGLYSSGYLVSEDVTAGGNASNVTAYWDVTAGGAGSSTTVDFSADSGSNYTTGLTNNSYKAITIAGTGLRIRLNFTADTAELQSPYFEAYGYQWME